MDTEIVLCHACRTPLDYSRPDLWFPRPVVHKVTQTLVVMTHHQCCGALSHTEPVASVSAYLRPVKAHARFVCGLVNQHLLLGRPEPTWLTEAWANWEETFKSEG